MNTAFIHSEMYRIPLQTPYSSTARQLKICYVKFNTFYTKNNIFKHVAQPSCVA
jgi:hypothetical protein